MSIEYNYLSLPKLIRSQAEKALKENGYTGHLGRKDDFTVYSEEGANTKIVRNNASSTNGSTIDVVNDKNKPIKKIRLKDE